MNPARIVALYPRAWRDRYGDEFHQLLLDELADGSAGRWWWLNPAVHGVRARLDGPPRASSWPGPLFAVCAVSIWSQLAVGWHWAAPANPQTRLGMVLMSAGLLLTAVAGAAHVRSVNWRTRSSAAFLIALAVLLGGATYLGHHWPGAVGHPWSARDLVPAPLARIAWAATLSVSAYWAHPHALARLGALQLAWMVASLLLLMTLALSAARLSRPPHPRRSPLTISGMGVFVIGALCWSVCGGSGPHGLYAPGVIDLGLIAAGVAALGAAATMRLA
jgi:hypothetical protein